MKVYKVGRVKIENILPLSTLSLIAFEIAEIPESILLR